MLYRTNIMAVVKEQEPMMLHLRDDHQKRWIYENFAFKSAIKTVKLRHELLVVVLPDMTNIYSFTNLKLI